MIPVSKVKDLIQRHSLLEKELSSGDIDKKKFAEKYLTLKRHKNLVIWLWPLITLKKNMIQNNISVEEISIKLLCYPRIWGYVFNPLSVFFIYDKKSNLISILYEVKNTFNEQHTYIFKLKKQMN